jgi:hypothetical protein
MPPPPPAAQKRPQHMKSSSTAIDRVVQASSRPSTSMSTAVATKPSFETPPEEHATPQTPEQQPKRRKIAASLIAGALSFWHRSHDISDDSGPAAKPATSMSQPDLESSTFPENMDVNENPITSNMSNELDDLVHPSESVKQPAQQVTSPMSVKRKFPMTYSRKNRAPKRLPISHEPGSSRKAGSLPKGAMARGKPTESTLRSSASGGTFDGRSTYTTVPEQLEAPNTPTATDIQEGAVGAVSKSRSLERRRMAGRSTAVPAVVDTPASTAPSPRKTRATGKRVSKSAIQEASPLASGTLDKALRKPSSQNKQASEILGKDNYPSHQNTSKDATAQTLQPEIHPPPRTVSSHLPSSYSR